MISILKLDRILDQPVVLTLKLAAHYYLKMPER